MKKLGNNKYKKYRLTFLAWAWFGQAGERTGRWTGSRERVAAAAEII